MMQLAQVRFCNELSKCILGLEKVCRLCQAFNCELASFDSVTQSTEDLNGRFLDPV